MKRYKIFLHVCTSPHFHSRAEKYSYLTGSHLCKNSVLLLVVLSLMNKSNFISRNSCIDKLISYILINIPLFSFFNHKSTVFFNNFNRIVFSVRS